MAETVAYEEQRRRQIEANKRKLEELQLHHLSAAVREAAAAAKPSSAKKRKARVPRDAVAEPLRRSGRLANIPENKKPVYREDNVNSAFPQDSDEERSYQDSDEERSYQDSDEERGYQDSDEERSYAISKAEKPMYRHVNARKRNAPVPVPVPLDAAKRSYAISKAKELVQELGSSFPIFTQPMTLSHVTGRFRMGLPKYFWQKYLPRSNQMITLVDEEDNKSCMLYLGQKAELTNGWKGFAIEHKLLDGDCLVFQLIKPTKFKVYIIRATS